MEEDDELSHAKVPKGVELFVGQDVEVIDGDNHVFHDDVLNRTMHETCDDKYVHLCIIVGEDGQLMVALVKHNFDRSTNKQLPKVIGSYPNSDQALPLAGWMISCIQATFFKNQLDVCMCFASQALDYITNVGQTTRNLKQSLH